MIGDLGRAFYTMATGWPPNGQQEEKMKEENGLDREAQEAIERARAAVAAGGVRAWLREELEATLEDVKRGQGDSRRDWLEGRADALRELLLTPEGSLKVGEARQAHEEELLRQSLGEDA